MTALTSRMVPPLTAADLAAVAHDLRRTVLAMHAHSRASHVGGALSCIDILCALYGAVLRVDPRHPDIPWRDRFILSKGHAVSALYAVLAARGFFPAERLESFHIDGGTLSGHPDRLAVPGIEASTGSLGHGLPLGVGYAHGLRNSPDGPRIYVLLSDGEIQEGSVWEAANYASRFRLGNLCAIVDANRWQAYDRTDSLMPISSYAAKFQSFGWSTTEIDGHDMNAILQAFGFPDPDRPRAIIAHTVKGKGVPVFEDRIEWHYRSPAVESLADYLGPHHA